MTIAPLHRRSFLSRAAAFGLTTALSTTLGARLAAAAWNKPAFDGKTMADTLKQLGVDGAKDSGDVQIIASDIAENGAVVPVQAVSKIPDTTRIAFLVEKNPNTLAALFDIGPDMVADVTTRIKMGQTSNVIVVVTAGGKNFTATKEIKVTLGGCGG